MGWKKILAGCVPFAVVLVMASIKGLFTRSPTDSVAHAARLVWLLGVLRAFICPRARMPELTIYRQTDLESAPSSTLARQQAADVTPAPATTTEDAHFLSPIFRQFSRHWKKGTSSDA
ncbi:hypothetical protein PENDEC_c004G05422 [Penicillium decumbens]|uniref:Uncharacterized protein n=1 Tax=Penicillium decumbens TaxID=69771 RepID=A0A1V6PHD4_PENDC|nr:hypothetical protein PENDEC_c004G05422 [Penicillium decumbens]